MLVFYSPDLDEMMIFEGTDFSDNCVWRLDENSSIRPGDDAVADYDVYSPEDPIDKYSWELIGVL